MNAQAAIRGDKLKERYYNNMTEQDIKEILNLTGLDTIYDKLWIRWYNFKELFIYICKHDNINIKDVANIKKCSYEAIRKMITGKYHISLEFVIWLCDNFKSFSFHKQALIKLALKNNIEILKEKEKKEK